jgi:tetraacyldisaccharide 4'-kinase
MIIFLRILLLPFSLLYFIVIYFRNLFFDYNIFKSVSVQKPVVSVGNISTGGTGKSPFTIFLTGHFIKNNLKPAIISRGYKGESDNIEIVYDGEKLSGSTAKSGDEPVMMANNLSLNFKNFFIITGSDRVKASEFAINKFNPDVILLDDAFQHRKIKRNPDIVLIDAEDFKKNKFYNTVILPSGNLRENNGNLKRADIIIQNNKFSDIEKLNELEKYKKEIFILKYKIKGFYNKENKEFKIEGKNVSAFAGLANPASFFSMLNSCKCNSIKQIAFKDHHKYTKEDIEQITKNADKETLFITTEKDFVKVKEYKDFLNYFNVLFMKIELILNDEERFFSLINKIAGIDILK